MVAFVTTFAPDARLRRQVASIEVVSAAPGQRTVVLPATAAVLGLQFCGRVRAGETLLSPAGVTGIQDGPRTYSYEGATGSVLVRFTAQGAASLGAPVEELTNRSVSLDELLPYTRVAEVLERLCAAADNAGRVALVEGLLLELSFARDPVVTFAIERLSDPEQRASVATIAREIGLSERHLERRFLARVGLTPKRFASLARFERVVALAKVLPTLAAVASRAGYYDESHLNRDVRRFSGTSPARLREY
jgi:AraC-like DNA-binding protein